MDTQIIGNHHWKEIQYEVPEWHEDDVEPDFKACFIYKGHTYFLSEFMKTDKNSPFHSLGFHGALSDSFFSGVLIKLNDCSDAVQAFTYYS